MQRFNKSNEMLLRTKFYQTQPSFANHIEKTKISNIKEKFVFISMT